MIPKIFHRIWLGSKPLPDYALAYGEGWLQHHPGWEMKLWTDENIPPLINQKEFDAADDTGRRPDILRYELLLAFGGIYLDVDMECQKNLEALIGDAEAFAGRESAEALGSAIIGCTKGHPFLQDTVDSIPESLRNAVRQHILWDAVGETGPWFLTLVARRHPEVKLFDPHIFYPCHWSQWDKRHASYPEAYAVHRWGGTWCQDA